MLTGYQVHEVANELLKEYGFDTIPPQMVYNYIKQGRIPAVDANGTHKPYAELKGSPYFVTVQDTKEWVTSFVESKRNPSNSSSEVVSQIIAELRSED